MKFLKISIDEEGYPPLLRHIYDPPKSLNVWGRFPDFNLRPPVAIVGSRKPTDHGKDVAYEIGKGLSLAGFTIISGLAYGIDSIAHKAAVENGGTTIAVLGSGLNNIYPASHKRLAEEIVKKEGAVVSEYEYGEEPLAYHFPLRNRIVCGMSLGVVIVEATFDSGTLISARLAMEQNREVFAVPGLAGHVNSAGPHKLLREGAALVENAQDIIDALEPKLGEGWKSKFSGQSFGIGVKERKLLDMLSDKPVSVDGIVEMTGLPPNEVLKAITLLELTGLVADKKGKGYIRLKTHD